MSPTPEEVAHLVQHLPGFVWLDGQRTLMSWDPVETCDAGDWVEEGRRLTAGLEDPAEGVVMGFVGFGAGDRVEAVPPGGPVPEGPFQLARYPGALIWEEGRWRAGGEPGFRRRAEEVLRAAGPLSPPLPAPRPTATTVDPTRWKRDVEAVRELLAAGDCYQVNLTRPVWLEGVDDPWSVYRRLRQTPAAHGAFLRTPATVILSNSPELLLSVHGRALATDPIKGTRARAAHPEDDARLARELLLSAKDLAELTMIVDLVRNDLGRVATPGTVRPAARRVTSFPTVHHASCRVEAQLRPDLDLWDALAACFPPGSVTGAPKVRACERIAQLEPHPRGAYCGTIGWATATQGVFNVAIRTAIQQGSSARFHVGGGIVIDSEPDDEWRETEHKARALEAAFGVRTAAPPRD